MKDEMDMLSWFLWYSWSYLGCNRGTARWRARWRYVRGAIPAYWRFRQSMVKDRANGFIV